MIASISLPVLDPEIFSIQVGGFSLALRWYALSYVVGFLVAWRWFVHFMRQPHLWPNGVPPMDVQMPERLLTWIIVGIIIGGRLGYTLIYNPSYYLQNAHEIPMIWKGGMSFHSAFLGLIVATILFCRKHGLNLGSVSDAISITVTPGLFLGRLANFINAELFGRPTEFAWGVVYPVGPASICPPHWEGICARHPSQLYEAVLEGLIIGAMLTWLAYRRGWLRKPWKITALFFGGYAIARILVEAIRQPDQQFVTPNNPVGYAIRFGETMGLTMGQLLSLPMLAFSILVFFLILRRHR